METDQHTVNAQSEDFQAVLKELIRIKDTYIVDKQLKWYKDHAVEPMILFRISGVLVILLSVSIPFMATLEGFWKTIVLPVVALLVAALTGITAFYRWESNWKAYRQSQMKLEYLLSIWELNVAEASHQTDTKQAIAMAINATKQLLDAAYATTSSETDQYFQLVQMPQSKQG